MTLKTLKDLKFENKELAHAGWLIWHHELRAEATKWIKELSMRESYQEHTERSGPTDLIHSMDWVKYFFNITEEELK